MRQAGFEAAKKAGDAKAKARTDYMAAAKAQNPDLRKLDNSGPTGMPPPSGTTEASEATKGESRDSNVAGKADDVPATNMEDARALKAEEEAAEEIDVETFIAEQRKAQEKAEVSEASAGLVAAADEEEVLEGKGEAAPEVPSAKDLEQSANVAIAEDEDKLGKGKEAAGKASSEAIPDIPTAKEVQEKANEAMAKDESDDPQPRSANASEPVGTTSSVNQTDSTGNDQKLEKNGSLRNTASLEGDAEEAITGKGGEAKGPKTRSGDEEDGDIAKQGGQEAEKVKKTTSATDEAEALPGTKTQDQPAASGGKVGESVAD